MTFVVNISESLSGFIVDPLADSHQTVFAHVNGGIAVLDKLAGNDVSFCIQAIPVSGLLIGDEGRDHEAGMALCVKTVIKTVNFFVRAYVQFAVRSHIQILDPQAGRTIAGNQRVIAADPVAGNGTILLRKKAIEQPVFIAADSTCFSGIPVDGGFVC